MKTDRREFMTGLGAFCAVPVLSARADDATPAVRFGLVSDLHYANRDPVDHGAGSPAGKVYFRESLAKLKNAVAVMNARRPDFFIELGDFKDFTVSREATLPYLDAVEAEFVKFKGPCYHVLGNHDMDCLTKAIFFDHVRNNGVRPTRGYYSFDAGGITFIALDACFNDSNEDYEGHADGTQNWSWDHANVPPAELEWLRKTLAAAKNPAVVFCHQRLDPNAWNAGRPSGDHGVRNAAAVREILERSGRVKAVFTGHEHRGGVCTHRGIHYHSIVALAIDGPAATNNSFAEVAVYPDGSVSVTAFRR